MCTPGVVVAVVGVFLIAGILVKTLIDINRQRKIAKERYHRRLNEILGIKGSEQQ